MHYAVEGHTILELRALYLPMNALCRIVEIGCTISEIHADCLYLAGKRCKPVCPSEIYRLYDKYKLEALSPMFDDISHPIRNNQNP